MAINVIDEMQIVKEEVAKISLIIDAAVLEYQNFLKTNEAMLNCWKGRSGDEYCKSAATDEDYLGRWILEMYTELQSTNAFADQSIANDEAFFGKK